MTTRANLYIDQGTDYLISMDIFTDTGQDFPADDYNFYASARKLYSTSKAFDFEARIVRDDSDINNFELYVSPETTRDLEPGKYQYDVLMVPVTGSAVQKIVEGLIFILPTTTRIE